jgi:hypothetical protein
LEDLLQDPEAARNKQNIEGNVHGVGIYDEDTTRQERRLEAASGAEAGLDLLCILAIV